MQPSVNQIASMYRGNPAPLQQRVQQERQANQGLPADLKELLALQILTEERDSASRQQAIQQLSQTGGQQPTVAQSLQQRAQQALQASNVQEQRKQEGLKGLMERVPSGNVPPNTPQPQRQPQGIDELQSNMGQFAGGGIVAFAEGGKPEYETPYDRMNRENRERERSQQVINLPKGTSNQEAELVRMQNPEAKVVVEGQGALLKGLREGVGRALTYSSDVEAQKSRKAASGRDNRALLNAADAGLRSMPPEALPPEVMSPPPAKGAPAFADFPSGPAPAAALRAAQGPAAPAVPVTSPGGLADALTPDVRAARQKMMIDAMNRDPAAMAQQMRDRYASEVGAPNTAGLEQLAQELQEKRARMQERNKNIDPLVENLTAIANAPRGQKWMYSLLAGSEAVDKARQGRETQDFELLKQIVEQQNKIEDVKRGYKGQMFTLGEKEREQVYKDAFSAAKELGMDDRAATQLAQEAMLRREQMASAERNSQRAAARENQSTAMNNQYLAKMAQARKLQEAGDAVGAARLMAEANDILMVQGRGASAERGATPTDRLRAAQSILEDFESTPEEKAVARRQIMQISGAMESGSSGAPKIMTQADVLATAKSSGKTPQQVIEAAKARGYTIQ